MSSELSPQRPHHLPDRLLIPAIPAPLALLFSFNQSSLRQDCHVMRNGGLGQLHTPFDISRTQAWRVCIASLPCCLRRDRAFLQCVQYASSCRIGNGMKCAVKRGVVRVHGTTTNIARIDDCQCSGRPALGVGASRDLRQGTLTTASVSKQQVSYWAALQPEPQREPSSIATSFGSKAPSQVLGADCSLDPRRCCCRFRDRASPDSLSVFGRVNKFSCCACSCRFSGRHRRSLDGVPNRR
jgi:hypothetical protein